MSLVCILPALQNFLFMCKANMFSLKFADSSKFKPAFSIGVYDYGCLRFIIHNGSATFSKTQYQNM